MRDTVRIALSPTKPALSNEVFHTLDGSDPVFPVNALDTDVWALAMTDRCSLVVSEIDPAIQETYQSAIARGKVNGAKGFGGYGQRTAAADESNRVIWPNGIFSLPDAAGVQMSIASTSGSDTAAGTGVRSIEIHYLDVDLIEQSEIVTMNGITPVPILATDVRFINDMHVHTYGTSPNAIGTISATNGGVTYSIISLGDNKCTSSARMIPASKSGYVAGAIGGAVSGTSDAEVVIRLVASEINSNQYVYPLNLFPYGSVGAQDTTIPYVFPLALKFSAGTVIALTASTDKIAIISGSWFGWIEDIAL